MSSIANSATVEQLTFEERAEWVVLRAKAKDGAKKVDLLFEAIEVIRDKRLYRADYATFKEYLETEVGISKAWAYLGLKSLQRRRKIKAASPDANIEEVDSLSCRTLATVDNVPEEQQAEAIQEAVAMAAEKSIPLNDAILKVCSPDDDEELESHEQVQADDAASQLTETGMENPFEPISVLEEDFVRAMDGIGGPIKAAKFIYQNASETQREIIRIMLLGGDLEQANAS